MISPRTRPAATIQFPLFPSIGEYPVYDDVAYNAFDSADRRVRLYREAIAAAAPGRVVLDVGTGRDALWAVAAAEAGARHVYAIEALPSAAEQARRAVAGNDRITVVEGLSTGVTLPERAEVCVSEILGNIASAEGVLPVLDDARRRLCAPECVWIPFRARTYVAAVDFTGVEFAIAQEAASYVRKIFEVVGWAFDLRLCVGGPVHTRQVSTAAIVETLTDGTPFEAETEVDLEIDTDAARVTGLILWTVVAVSPALPEIDTLRGDTRAWAPVYVPLGPVDTRPGDRIRVTFTRRTSDDGRHPDYTISTDLPGAAVWDSPHHGRNFRATTLHRALFKG